MLCKLSNNTPYHSKLPIGLFDFRIGSRWRYLQDSVETVLLGFRRHGCRSRSRRTNGLEVVVYRLSGDNLLEKVKILSGENCKRGIRPGVETARDKGCGIVGSRGCGEEGGGGL